MTQLATAAVPDLRSHFGLATVPFTRELPISQRWRSPLFDEPLAHLLTAVNHRQSALLCAPSGTGKTVLLRALADALPAARYRLHYVKLTTLSRRDLCREIATACGLEPRGGVPLLLRALQLHFTARSDDDGLRPVLLLDEVQDLPVEVLAILRLLTNFDLDSRLLLSLVLAGDRRLLDHLERQQLEPVRRRIAHVASLRLLSRAESRDYVAHRLTIAGSTTCPFDEPAIDAVYEIARGNLRAIDHLCLKALELAAYRNTPAIDPTLVAEARKHLLL